MTKLIQFIFLLGLAGFSLDVPADVTSQLIVNSSETREVSASEPSEWRIKLTDQRTGKILKKFRRLHTRDMHMVVVKRDLSSFAHVHPVLIGNTGVFHTIINQPSFDPDNEQAAHAISSPGEYYVFTETSPRDRPELAYIELSRMAITAPGQDQDKLKEFLADRLDQVPGHHGSFSITKYFKINGRPNPDKPWQKSGEYQVVDGTYGDDYRVRLQAGLTPGCGGNMVQFHLDIETWDESNQSYKTEREFTPWLGMEAHAVLLEADLQKAADNIQFLHLHGMRHEEHNSLMYSHFDRHVMSGRNYRAWFQVKHNGHITTFPFSFHYMAHYNDKCD